MKTILSFFFGWLFCFSTEAQILLSLPSLANEEFYLENCTIQEVRYDKKSAILGELVGNTKGKNTIELKNGIERSFANLLQNKGSYNKNKTSILLIIRELSIKEIPTKTIVKGTCLLLIDYYALRGTDTLFLCNAQASQPYERTIEATNPKHFEALILKNISYCHTYFRQWLNSNQSKHEGFTNSSKIILLPDYTKSDSDTLYYTNQPLSWNDFQGKPPLQNKKYAASIFASIAQDIEITIENQVIIARIQPKTYMVRGISWVIETEKNDYALRHEQLHFDIAQVVMNRYKKKVMEISESTPDDLSSRIQYEYLEAYREMNRLQKEYDTATNHGLNVQLQQDWDRQITTWKNEK